METAQLFPGIYFDSVSPVPEETLPRMDIVAFVGFAGAGPLHTPVPVEDVTRFRDIFGNDVSLAWNVEKGEMEYGYLGPTVEAYFRNGGRRCWIVRVADESAAYTHRFQLPGLIRTDGEQVEAGEAIARCPGSWAEDYRIGTVLQITQLQFDESAAQNNGKTISFHVNSSGWSVDVKTPPAQLVAGDLLQINFEDNQQKLFGFIDDIVPQKNGTRLRGINGFWCLYNTPLSPPLPDSITSDSTIYSLYRLSDTDRLGLSVNWPGGSPLYARPRVRLLRFEILAWRAHVLEYRFSNMAFSLSHPRFWGRLPTDKTLFRQSSGRPISNISAEMKQFREQASLPRFPFAGPENTDAKWFYLPINMSQLPEYEASQEPIGNYYSCARLVRDGLENFSSKHFLDKSLYWVNSGALQQEAEQRSYLSNTPVALNGIHSLFPIDEVTLISVPDATHRRWNQIPPPLQEPLPAPCLESVKEGETEDRYILQWTDVAKSTSYIVEQDASYEFEASTVYEVRGEVLPHPGEPVELLPEPDNHLEVSIVSQCPQVYYFRVRAGRHGEVGTWSNTRAMVIPTGEFMECDVSPPDLLALWLELADITSPPQRTRFAWRSADHRDDLLELVDTFELQRAGDAEFRSAHTIHKGLEREFEVSDESDIVHYFRVRAWRGKTAGPWSNIVRITLKTVSQTALQAVAEYTNNDLLGIHRALIRLCAARADLLAVLSVPHHFRQEEMLEYIAALIPAGPERTLELSAVGNSDFKVPALTLGERRTLSYAALYYPWMAIQTKSTDSEITTVRFLPPDGPITGLIARRTLEQGAWFAPANDHLVDVVALEPWINRDYWSQLMQTQVNVIRQTSRGFLVLNADTLSSTRELRSINIRRLLILLRRLVLREGNNYVFEPNDEGFRDSVRHCFECLLSDMYTRGAFAGTTADSAYRVVADSSVNIPQSIDKGRFVVELQVAPSEPLKFLKVRLVQSGPNQLQVQEV